MRQIRFELRKIWGARAFCLLVALLLGCNLFFLWNDTRQEKGCPPAQAYRLLDEELDKTNLPAALETLQRQIKLLDGVSSLQRYIQQGITQGDRFLALWEEYGGAYTEQAYLRYCADIKQERNLLTDVYGELDAIAQYRAFIDSLDNRAQGLAGLSIFRQDAYLQRNIEKTQRDFAHLHGVQIEYSTAQGLALALDSETMDLFLFFAIFLVAAFSIQKEKDSEMLCFIQTTPKGRRQTAWAKLAAAFLSNFGVVFLLYGVRLLYCAFRFGLGDLARPIQSVPQYVYCTLPVTEGEFILLFLLFKWLAAALLETYVFAFYLLLPNGVAAALASGMWLGLNYLPRIFIPVTNRYYLFRFTNVISILQTDEVLAQYQNLDLFGTPVSRWMVELAFALAALVLSMTVFVEAFQRGCFLKERKKARARHLLRGHGKTLWLQETAKLAALHCCIPLLLFAAFQVYECATSERYFTPEEKIFNGYLEKVEGNYDAGARAYLQSEAERLARGLRAETLYRQGEITLEELQALEAQQIAYEMQGRAFSRVISQIYYIKEHPGAQFANETAYGELLMLNHPPAGAATLILVVCLVLSLSSLIAVEYQTGMIELLRSTPRGRGEVAARRLALASGLCFAFALCFYLPGLYTMVKYYGWRPLTLSACSIADFSALPAWVSIGMVWAFAIAVSYAAVWMVGMVTLAFSRLLKNSLFAAFAAIVVFTAPVFLNELGFSGFRWVSILPPMQAAASFVQDGFFIVAYAALALLTGGLAALYVHDSFGVSALPFTEKQGRPR